MGYHANPTEPKLKLPAGAADCHFHIFAPKGRFPNTKDATYVPEEAPQEALVDRHLFLSIERGVVMQSGAHGANNSAAADFIGRMKGKYVGVALVPPTVEVAELKRLHEQGFRGARFDYLQHLPAGPALSDLMKFAGKLASLGWHLQLDMEPTLIQSMSRHLKVSPVPVVIDHMGRIDASRGMDQPGFKHLLSLLQDKRIWVKVSGLERASRHGAPYPDAVPFARKLVAEFGDRCVWGTDWPHLNVDAVPDDGLLVDLIAEYADESQRQALLVDNPMKLYKFPS